MLDMSEDKSDSVIRGWLQEVCAGRVSAICGRNTPRGLCSACAFRDLLCQI